MSRQSDDADNGGQKAAIRTKHVDGWQVVGRRNEHVEAVAIPADHPSLSGHFPGNPIVPGVVLLDAAMAAIGRARGAAPAEYRLASVKFLHPVKPPAILTVRHADGAGSAVDFRIDDGTRVVASGRVEIDQPAGAGASAGGSETANA